MRIKTTHLICSFFVFALRLSEIRQFVFTNSQLLNCQYRFHVRLASKATVLIAQFNVEALVFTGVAGGLMEDQHVGDIVLAVRQLKPMRQVFTHKND